MAVRALRFGGLRGFVYLFVWASLLGWPAREAYADPCPGGVLPQNLIGVAQNPLFSGFSANYPWAAMVTWAAVPGIGGTVYGLDAECFDLAEGVMAAPAAGASPVSATVDWNFLDGYLFGRQNAFVTPEAGATGSPFASAQSEFGFRDIFDVTSQGTDPVQLDFSIEFSGVWSEPLCFQGSFRNQPIDQFHLYIRDVTPPPSTSILRASLTTPVDKIGVHPIAGDYSVTILPNTTVVVDLYFLLSVSAPSNTLFENEVCPGGESIAQLDAPSHGLLITFSTPSSGVTIVPRSGIDYSSTVPEPTHGLLAGLAALGLLARRRHGHGHGRKSIC